MSNLRKKRAIIQVIFRFVSKYFQGYGQVIKQPNKYMNKAIQGRKTRIYKE